MAQGGGGRDVCENARIGRMAERAVYDYYVPRCEAVRRTGVGSDFFAAGCGGGARGGYHEIKANGAPLTPRQQEMRDRLGPLYHVDRARCDSHGCEFP